MIAAPDPAPGGPAARRAAPPRARAAARPWRPLALAAGLLSVGCAEQGRRLRTVDQVYAETFRRFDVDGDGSLSEAELRRTDPTGSMQQIDADRDGRVTVAELRSWTELTHPRPPFLKPMGEGGERQRQGEAPPPVPDPGPPEGPATGPPIPGMPQAPPLPGAPMGPPTGGPLPPLGPGERPPPPALPPSPGAAPAGPAPAAGGG